MELVRLRKEDVKEFKQLMIDAFQCGYESVYGKSEEQILPEKSALPEHGVPKLNMFLIKCGTTAK